MLALQKNRKEKASLYESKRRKKKKLCYASGILLCSDSYSLLSPFLKMYPLPPFCLSF
jgi:hypothetical protein